MWMIETIIYEGKRGKPVHSSVSAIWLPYSDQTLIPAPDTVCAASPETQKHGGKRPLTLRLKRILPPLSYLCQVFY